MSYKKWIYIFSFLPGVFSCGTSQSINQNSKEEIRADIDLINIQEDKVLVTIDPEVFSSASTTFYLPKIVPGTYSLDNYGQNIEDLKAYDYEGNELPVISRNTNEWFIEDAKNLDKVRYYVNDTYDTETQKKEPIFSPAGTNISEGKNFVLNLHGFVGYFKDLLENPYVLQIYAPENLTPVTSLNRSQNVSKEGVDIFYAKRYFDVIDNPIMYSELNTASFMVDGIEITIGVYSPNGVYAADDLRPSIEKMMRAQKSFLGEINTTPAYTILLYLSAVNEEDAIGFGALEHHTSTVAVLPEQMNKKDLEETMIDLISHEFFHIVTPLNVHSREIQYFNFNNPKMSKHLWMYEGTTEYFANLFQIQQGIIDEQDFLQRMSQKIDNSSMYNDSLSFTSMSSNVLIEPNKSNYANVYEKGALINMCLDILLRDLSDGERGVLWLMKELSLKYNQNIPFDDDKIIEEIVSMTYPEIGNFFDEHIVGDTSIDYDEVLKKVGLHVEVKTQETGYFFYGQEPFIDVRPDSQNSIFVRKGIPLNSFWINLGVKGGDTIVSIDGISISLENLGSVIRESFTWKPTRNITMRVKRGDNEITLQGVVGTPVLNSTEIVPSANSSEAEQNLKHLWLKD